MSGPYASEGDASRAVPRAVAALHAAGRDQVGDHARAVFAAQLAALTEACKAAGVELGDYDRRVLEWLARWEPTTVQVVADLITRAGRR